SAPAATSRRTCRSSWHRRSARRSSSCSTSRSASNPRWSRRSRPLFPRRAEPVQHRFDGADLLAVLGVIRRSRIAPPIPAGARVERIPARFHLGVEHDQEIRLCPAVVSRVAREAIHALPTTMERDVDPAAFLLAAPGYVDQSLELREG